MKRITLLLGTGGVGKTTVSAALGLALSEKQKGALFTIDPSLRLCQTLGLDKLSLSVQNVNPSLEAYGLEIRDGLRLLLTKVLHDPARAEKILSHRLFKMIEGNLSHLDHFLAIEKIVELIDRPELEFLVIDTPPHDQAFEFFDAPRVLTEFLDKAFLRVLLDSSAGVNEGFFARLLSRAIDEGWKQFRSLLGDNFWVELSELLKELLPLRERLIYSTKRWNEELRSSASSVLVSTLDARALDTTFRLQNDWQEKMHIDVDAWVLTRTLPQALSWPMPLQNTAIYRQWQHEQAQRQRFLKQTPNANVIEFERHSPNKINQARILELGYELRDRL